MQAPLFAAELTPNASLTERGQRVLVIITALLAAIPGIVFFSMGAWPVIGLMGLDVLLLWWALDTVRRRSSTSEQVTLWPDVLEVRRTAAGGGVKTDRFDPYFVRLVVDRDVADRVSRLKIRTPERQVELGRFMGSPDKASFAQALERALHRARGK